MSSEASDYDCRLDAVRRLGELFPGYRSGLGHEHRRLGLFAGIYLQTRWQRNTGRDALPHWFLVNQGLTLAAYAYALEYLADPDQPCARSRYVGDHPTRDAANAPVTQVDTCRAWKAYFRAATARRPRSELRRLLWRAHTTSIRHALWQYEAEFDRADVPASELTFWRVWIKVVLAMERPAPATTDWVLGPLLSLSMPAGAPLGSSRRGRRMRPLTGAYATPAYRAAAPVAV